MSTRSERAAARRATWTGEVVQAGARKGALYADLPLAERWPAFTALNNRAWAIAGHSPEPTDRAKWPGEVFELRRHG